MSTLTYCLVWLLAKAIVFIPIVIVLFPVVFSVCELLGDLIKELSREFGGGTYSEPAPAVQVAAPACVATAPIPKKKAKAKRPPPCNAMHYMLPRVPPEPGYYHLDADSCDADLRAALAAEGYRVTRGDIGDFHGIGDPEQLAFARDRRATLLTGDKGFFELDARGLKHAGILFLPKTTTVKEVVEFLRALER